MTIANLREYEDELVTLYNLLKPDDDCSIYEMPYYNSPQYRSKLYKFINSLTNEQIDILNKALIIGYWIYDDIIKVKYEYLQNPTLENIHISDIEKWCSKVRSSSNSITYISLFLTTYLGIYNI